MSERLDAIVQATRARLAERKLERPQDELERLAEAAAPPRDFAAALSRPGIAVIAEHKRRSPSAGVIRAGATVAEIVGCYERGGAAALSILTERDHFDGSLADLDEARRATSLPLLRKDFTIDPYQLLEARAHGADAVLLVVGALSAVDLAQLAAAAAAVGLAAIVEVHDDAELARALEIEAPLIGINNRNLVDFSVDIERTVDLFAQVPSATTVISESGITTPDHLARLERLGVDAVLVGEALMRAADPAAACRELTSAVRA